MFNRQAYDHKACFFYNPSEIWRINSLSIKLIFVNNCVILTVSWNYFGLLVDAGIWTYFFFFKLGALKDDFLDAIEFQSHILKVISTSWEIGDNKWYCAKLIITKFFFILKIASHICLFLLLLNCPFMYLVKFISFCEYSVLRIFTSHSLLRMFTI